MTERLTASGESDFEVDINLCLSVHQEYMGQNILSREKSIYKNTEPKQCGVFKELPWWNTLQRGAA